MKTVLCVSLILWLLIIPAAAGEEDGGRTALDCVELLGSEQYLEPTAAFNELYEMGAEAVPLLISVFDNETPYLGLCGSLILSSECLTYEIDEIDLDQLKFR